MRSSTQEDIIKKTHSYMVTNEAPRKLLQKKRVLGRDLIFLMQQ
jgi:hypothetical protein